MRLKHIGALLTAALVFFACDDTTNTLEVAINTRTATVVILTVFTFKIEITLRVLKIRGCLFLTFPKYMY